MSELQDSQLIVPPEAAGVFAGLAELFYDDSSDMEQVYTAICTAAGEIVPGCDHAAIMQGDDYATVAASSDLARQAQQIERETGEGACVDAIENEPLQIESNLHSPRRWGQLAKRLIAETPLRGVLGFRLLVEQRKVGSLNLFSETVHALDDSAIERGIVLASFASVTATAEKSGGGAGTLSEDIRKNREVDLAVHSLMVLRDRPEQQAYDRLERISQDINVKLEDVATMGALQSGFHAMATGLQGWQRVRDLFGRHVGGEVAAAAEREHPQMGGEERHVAVVFVDIPGSTKMITSRSAPEVVQVLNRFFSVIVEEVDRHHGLLNKFEGDAALAVFGAPNHRDNPENEALAAGRAIADRLAKEVSESNAGVGVASGEVVAGNVGTETRYEYTVTLSVNLG